LGILLLKRCTNHDRELNALQASLLAQTGLWGVCAAAVGVAALSIFADRRRNNRSDPDDVGFMPWPLILILSLLAAALSAAVALKAG
jgi:hypothetical protein